MSKGMRRGCGFLFLPLLMAAVVTDSLVARAAGWGRGQLLGVFRVARPYEGSGRGGCHCHAMGRTRFLGAPGVPWQTDPFPPASPQPPAALTGLTTTSSLPISSGGGPSLPRRPSACARAGPVPPAPAPRAAPHGLRAVCRAVHGPVEFPCPAPGLLVLQDTGVFLPLLPTELQRVTRKSPGRSWYRGRESVGAARAGAELRLPTLQPPAQGCPVPSRGTPQISGSGWAARCPEPGPGPLLPSPAPCPCSAPSRRCPAPTAAAWLSLPRGRAGGAMALRPGWESCGSCVRQKHGMGITWERPGDLPRPQGTRLGSLQLHQGVRVGVPLSGLSQDASPRQGAGC